MRTGPDASIFELWHTAKQDSLRLVPARAYHDDHCWVSLGLRKIFMPLSEEGVYHVMVRNVANYPRDRIFKRVLRAMIGNGLLISEGKDWKEQRKAIGHAFQPNAVKTIFSDVARFTDRALPQTIPCGRPTELYALIDQLAFDLALHTLSPTRGDAAHADRSALCYEMRDKLHADIWDAVLPAWMPVPRGPGRRRVARQLDAFIDSMVANHKAAAETSPADMLSQYIAAYGAQHDAPGGLRDQLKTFMITATNTLTDTLYPALALLAQNKAMQDWLHAAVADKDLASECIGQTLPKLTEIRAFLREVLRLYPALPLFWACATADDVIAGHAIKAGTLVLIAPWALHRHHKHWAEPNRFDLRRFLPGAPEPSRAIYVPFGTGPRVCIGQHLALAEATIILAKLIAQFEIAFADDECPSGSFLKKDCKFIFRLRRARPTPQIQPTEELENIAA